MVPRCPKDPSHTLERRPSTFAITRPSRSGSADEPDSPDDPPDPAMERALADIERDMAAIDAENPDPRQLGRVLRRFAETTGTHPGDRMDEMIRRLEAGENPDSISDDFPDLLDDDSDPDADSLDSPASSPAARALGRLRLSRRHRAPAIDPELHELDDFLPPPP